MKKEKKLVINKNKVIDFTNLGWIPIMCNKEVVAFVGKRKLKQRKKTCNKQK